MLSCETHISSSRFLSSSKPMYGRQYGSTAKRSGSGFFYLLCVWQSERRKKKEALDILHDNIADFETWRNVPWERERERYTTPRDTFISAPFRHHPRLSRGKNPIYGTRRGTCRHSAYIHWLIWSRQANEIKKPGGKEHNMAVYTDTDMVAELWLTIYIVWMPRNKVK